MQTVSQNQYDLAHEFNIHWPTDLIWEFWYENLKSVLILLKNICRRVEPLNGSLCLENSQHLGNRLLKLSLHPLENLDFDKKWELNSAHGWGRVQILHQVRINVTIYESAAQKFL